MVSVCTVVVVFHRSMVDWGRGWCLSVLLLWSSIDLWSIGGGQIRSVCTGICVFFSM